MRAAKQEKLERDLATPQTDMILHEQLLLIHTANETPQGVAGRQRGAHSGEAGEAGKRSGNVQGQPGEGVHPHGAQRPGRLLLPGRRPTGDWTEALGSYFCNTVDPISAQDAIPACGAFR